MRNTKNDLPELYSLEAESAVIGSLLLNPKCFDDIEPILQSQDFYLVHHRHIFEAISVFAYNNKAIDILTLSEYFKEKGVLEEIGGLAYLAEMVKNTPSSFNVEAYAKVVRQYSKQRQFLALGKFIISEVGQPKNSEQLDGLAEKIEKQYTDIVLSQTDKSAADLADIFSKMFIKMEKSALNADPVTGTPLGIQTIDTLTTGGQAGELIIIAARPAMGKTALSLTAAAIRWRANANCEGTSGYRFRLENII